MCPLSYYIAEKIPILKHCWGITFFVTLLSCSQSWNIADVYVVILHCWAVPKLITLLSHVLSYYLAELFPILKQCSGTPCLITMLRCSESWKFAFVLPVLLRCWAVPNPKTFLMFPCAIKTSCLLQPTIEHRNLHRSRQISLLLVDVILDSDWLPTMLRQNRQQCIRIDHSLAMY